MPAARPDDSQRASGNPSPPPPPRDGEGEQSLSFSPSPLRGGGRGEGLSGEVHPRVYPGDSLEPRRARRVCCTSDFAFWSVSSTSAMSSGGSPARGPFSTRQYT